MRIAKVHINSAFGNWSALSFVSWCISDEENMRLICFWCFVVAAAAQSQDEFYAPQTFKQRVNPTYQSGLFSPASNDVTPQSTIVEPWRPKVGPSFESWGGSAQSQGPRPEPWRMPYGISKEQQAAILHHKQALSSEGNFQYEYASDNGLAAGEVIQPDGSRVGSYQYKDPSGQIVKLKYKAGKEGFQILEGSHLPKQPEPVPPPTQDQHYIQAYEQQRQQYEMQQQYNQQRPDPQQSWSNNQQNYEGQRPQQYYQSNWRQGDEDDGQYRENDVYNKGPHTFGEGYAFAFKG